MKMNLSEIPSPSYVLDEELFERNLSIIQEVAQKSGVEIIMALKGFALWKVFPTLKQYIRGAAASGEYEAQLINDELGFKAHTFCPSITEQNIHPIARLSSHITFNSFSQYDRFKGTIQSCYPDISMGIRINPEYSEVETDLYNPCAPGSRLGVGIDEMPAKLPEGVEGIHFHTLCESRATDLMATLKAVEQKFGAYLYQAKWINMGGGHLMTHREYDRELLIETLKNFRKKFAIDIILEPGAAFVWETGYLVAAVTDIVENKGIKTAILDVSFTAHMPDCLEMPYKPKIIGAIEPNSSLPTYRMGGNSCLAGDFMGDWSFEKPLKTGDKIVFLDMIHYTMVKTTMFNGVAHPNIGMWTRQNRFELIRAFGYSDYKNRLS